MTNHGDDARTDRTPLTAFDRRALLRFTRTGAGAALLTGVPGIR